MNLINCQKSEGQIEIISPKIQSLDPLIDNDTGSLYLREEMMASILNSFNHAVFIIDFNMKIVYLNKFAEIIIGCSAEEATGKTCKEFFCNTVGFNHNNCNVKSVIDNHRPVTWKGMINDKRGRLIPIFCTASLLFYQDNYPIGVLITFADMTALEQSKGKQFELGLAAIIGKSRKMREMYYLIRSLSDSLSNVLIRGETGAGKGVVAKLIHFYSLYRSGPFIHVNCSAIPESLLESELFGHTKGAFTGATNDRKGRFELANDGTLFLDEIGDINLSMQTKLLRVVEEKKFEKLGSNEPIRSNVRIIAATNKNIEEAVLKGNFRADLYYRLNIIPISVPPLRERIEDLSLLINHFIDKLNSQYSREPKIKGVSSDAFDVLSEHSWPGNIRELENILEYVFIHCRDSNIIEVQHLPSSLFKLKTKKTNGRLVKKISANPIDKSIILEALEKKSWNRITTAKFLGLSRTTLWRKIEKYNLSPQKVKKQYTQ